VHVTVVDPETGTEAADRTVIVDGDRIVSIGESGAAAPPAKRVVDARGKWLIPGLWDMHVHFADPTWGALFVANGVTGVRVMWGNPRFRPGMERFHFDLRDSYDKGTDVGPRMVIASNIMDGAKPTWPNSLSLTTPDAGRKAVDDAKADGVDFIKVYSGLPRDVFLAIADESKKVALPFAGHVPDAVRVGEASDAGQHSIEHLTGMLRACSSHEDAIFAKWEAFDKTTHDEAAAHALARATNEEAMTTYDDAHAAALYAKLVKNGTWECPTLTVLHNFATLDDASHASDPRMAYVAPFMKNMWDPAHDFRTKSLGPDDYAFMRKRYAKQVEIVRALNTAHVPILAGTDEVNPYCYAGFSLLDEIGLLAGAGLSPAEALRAATSGPAHYFGWEAKMGTVAEGKVADLVVLDADPLADAANVKRTFAVVSRGVLHDRADLDAILARVKDAEAHGY
jgi:hypothetical protein